MCSTLCEEEYTGLVYGGGWQQVVVQLGGSAAVCVFGFLSTLLLVQVLDRIPAVHCRSNRWDEIIGLDLVRHRYDDNFDFSEEVDRTAMKAEFLALLERGATAAAEEAAADAPKFKRQESWIQKGLERSRSNVLDDRPRLQQPVVEALRKLRHVDLQLLLAALVAQQEDARGHQKTLEDVLDSQALEDILAQLQAENDPRREDATPKRRPTPKKTSAGAEGSAVDI
jgi:hypothetical protein